jgi:integrase
MDRRDDRPAGARTGVRERHAVGGTTARHRGDGSPWPSNAGSGRRRNGEPYVVWRVRRTNEAGVKRASTFESERDAHDFEARLRLLRRSNDLASLDAGRETLTEFVQEWWELEASSRLERATLKGYASHWNRHMLPRLGHLPLRDITPLTVTRFRSELEQAGVGDETIRRCLVLLQSILARAVGWQRISSNPVRAVRKPRTKRNRAVTPLAPSAVEALRRQMLARSRFDGATLLSLLAYAGLRPEEALALQWLHVRERALLIEQAVSDGELKGQKTGRPPRTVDLLAPLKQDLAEWRLACGRPPEDEFLFVGSNRGPWRHDHRNWRRRHFEPAAKAAGLPNARPYDLRYSFASLMLHAGRVSIVDLASQRGHSPTMTLNTCGHVIAELREAPKASAIDQIQAARQKDPKRTPQRENAIPAKAEDRAAPPKPTAGLEPATPSLRVRGASPTSNCTRCPACATPSLEAPGALAHAVRAVLAD